MSVLVSVVTPCYNHGQYLDEAINSIPYDKLDYEVEHIIVNDGSTDTYTNQKINEISDPRIKVIQKQNEGLSAARNTGINVAQGKYIIPLDADNKLHENYFTKAVSILEQQDTVDVVYGNFNFFGAENGIYKAGAFDLPRLLKNNYIDACAVIKKDVFNKFSVYDTKMLHGFEDWELWINLYLNGAVFFYLNDIGFYYRVTAGSMLKNITTPRAKEIREYIYQKHASGIIEFFLAKARDQHVATARYYYAKKHPVKTIIKLLLGKGI